MRDLHLEEATSRLNLSDVACLYQNIGSVTKTGKFLGIYLCDKFIEIAILDKIVET